MVGSKIGALERLESKYVPEPNTGCWLWTSALNNKGYGVFRFGNKAAYAHRVSFLLHVGEVPIGMEVCHRCDTPACVNPGHLFLGTHAENMRDMIGKSRHGAVTKPERLARGSRHGSRTKPEHVPSGDRNGARTKPENLARGERHGSKTKPHRVARGDRHSSRTKPECVARGDRNGARTKPETRARGENNGSSKLTREDVIQIRANGGFVSNKSLAMTFGVDSSLIGLVRRRLVWRHV